MFLQNVCNALNNANIPYAVVGGYAVALHGAVRGTVDCAGLNSDQIIDFLENYKMVIGKVPQKCKLISLKIEPSLLDAFKQKASLHGLHYQTKIKQLMAEWLSH